MPTVPPQGIRRSVMALSLAVQAIETSSMAKRVAIIQGYPDARGNHFCHALAETYATGAREGGHEVRSIDVGRIEFPILRTKEEFESGTPVDRFAMRSGRLRGPIICSFAIHYGSVHYRHCSRLSLRNLPQRIRDADGAGGQDVRRNYSRVNLRVLS